MNPYNVDKINVFGVGFFIKVQWNGKNDKSGI